MGCLLVVSKALCLCVSVWSRVACSNYPDNWKSGTVESHNRDPCQKSDYNRNLTRPLCSLQLQNIEQEKTCRINCTNSISKQKNSALAIQNLRIPSSSFNSKHIWAIRILVQSWKVINLLHPESCMPWKKLVQFRKIFWLIKKIYIYFKHIPLATTIHNIEITLGVDN
jgi:hypothetical protein